MDQISRFDAMAASALTGMKRKQQNKKHKHRRSITAVLVLSLIALIAIGFSVAPLSTRTNTLLNELEFGQAKISVIENDYDWDSKEVRLVVPIESGLVPGVARVMFVPYILDEDSEHYVPAALGVMTEPVNGRMVLGDIVLEFTPDWQELWFFLDGFFYYKTVLYPEPGRNETPVLLKKVSLNPAVDGVDDKYDGSIARVKVDVLASILQAGGSAADAGSVLDARWGVVVNGSSVSPRAS